MRIFLSYASDDEPIAERANQALLAEDHVVFYAPRKLRKSEGYHAEIRKQVDRCRLFLFLVSKGSVIETRYALLELRLAQDKWEDPAGHVLPVAVSDFDWSVLPGYLSTTPIERPVGPPEAHIARVVARATASRPIEWIKHLLRGRMVWALALTVVLLGAPILATQWMNAGPTWPEIDDDTSIGPDNRFCVGVAWAGTALGFLAVLFWARLGRGLAQRAAGAALLALSAFALFSYVRITVSHVKDLPGGRVLVLPLDEEHMQPKVLRDLDKDYVTGKPDYETRQRAFRLFYPMMGYDPEAVWQLDKVQSVRRGTIAYWILGFFAVSGLTWTVLTRPPSHSWRPRNSAGDE